MENNKGLINIIKKIYLSSNKILKVQFDLTYRCNLSCIHCYIDKRNLMEMNKNMVKSIIYQLYKLNCLELVLSGGEVFLYKDIFEIIEYARKLRFSIRIKTNGTLTGREEIEKLKNLGVNFVEVSLFSLSPDINDKITGIKGSLGKTLFTISEIERKKIPFRINTLLMKDNLNDYEKFYRYFTKKGIDVSINYMISPMLDGTTNNCSICIIDDEIINFERWRGTSQQKKMIKKDNEENDLICNAGHISLYISPDGEVYPCGIWRVKLGDLKRESLEEIWKNSKELKIIRSYRKKDLLECKGCEYKSFCGFCPGLSYFETKNSLIPSRNLCSKAKAIFEARKNV